MSDADTHPFYLPLLWIAVHNDLDQVRTMTPEELQRGAIAAADVVASGGDRLLRHESPKLRGGKAGREEFHQVWKATVRALAIAALQPGGTTFMGLRFDASRIPPAEPVERAEPEMVEAVANHLIDLWDLSVRLGVPL